MKGGIDVDPTVYGRIDIWQKLKGHLPMKKHFGYALLAAAFAYPAASMATTITFDSPLSLSGVSSYTESGVTFTGPTFSTYITPNGTQGLLEDSSPRNFLRADISGGTSMVSVDLGDYDVDSDRLFLDVYSSSSALLGHAELAIADSFSGMKTLSVSATGIAYAIFGATDAVNGSSVYADNFVFAPVPEPETYAMMLAGLGLLGFAARRRKQQAA
jgi:hypothetical protein